MPLRPAALLLVTLAGRAAAQAPSTYPAPVEGDFLVHDFRFASGETLSELRLHYTTVGTPQRDADSGIRNAVLILHGTGGTGRGFLSANFAGRLFGPGQLLDAGKYFIVLPDGIGHGKSSKPSDGLRMKFPQYGYEDMVRAQYRLLTEGLGVRHLRLVLGTSMGAMHAWVWGYRYPAFMDALMPLASNPVEIAGRNRWLRQMIVDDIQNDSDWQQGEYTTQPVRGLAAAEGVLLIMTSVPLQMQKDMPTRAAAESTLHARVTRAVAAADANDMIYQFQASRDYNPLPHLEQIQAPLFAVNSADDQVNPPELGILDREIKRVPRGRYILLPISDQTRGHGTHSLPAIWGNYLAELLAASQLKEASAGGISAVDQVSGTGELLIAVSAVSDRVAWASGARGTFVRTSDGGATWQAAQVPGAERLQFRDVYARDANTAWLLSIGNADTSRIYHTTDGGKTWALQFTNPEPKAFYDCFDFWDARHGLAISDAAGPGAAVLLRTDDGGSHWTRLPPRGLPEVAEGEGAFAASGTCLITRPGGHAWVALGTPKARLLHTGDYGRSWSSSPVPLAAISSVSFRDLRTGIVLGTDTTAATAVTTDGGKTWSRGARAPFAQGFYGGAFVPGSDFVVAVGPGGAAYSADRGAGWSVLNTNNYWGIGFAPNGTGWIVGRGGRITRLSGF